MLQIDLCFPQKHPADAAAEDAMQAIPLELVGTPLERLFFNHAVPKFLASRASPGVLEFGINLGEVGAVFSVEFGTTLADLKMPLRVLDWAAGHGALALVLNGIAWKAASYNCWVARQIQATRAEREA